MTPTTLAVEVFGYLLGYITIYLILAYLAQRYL